MQFESKGTEEFVDLKAELLVEGSLERWKHERELEWEEVRMKEEQSKLSERPAPPSKCLYEQLRDRQEQKETEREQQRSLKNYVYTGPSEEEINLIQSISSNEEEQRLRIAREERVGLEEFRKKIEFVKREETENKQQEEEQQDIITQPSTTNTSNNSKKKNILSSVVIKPKRTNRKRASEGNGKSKKETNSRSRKERNTQTGPAAKRPALVSYSSDSDIEKEGLKST